MDCPLKPVPCQGMDVIATEPIPETTQRARKPGPGTPAFRDWVLDAIHRADEQGEQWKHVPNEVRTEIGAHDFTTMQWLESKIIRDHTGKIKTTPDGKPVTLAQLASNHQQHMIAEKRHLIYSLIQRSYESGYICIMFHATLPGRYHYLHGRRGKVPYSPRELNDILYRKWRNCYKQIKKLEGCDLSYISAPEPHEDATPHMHGVIMVQQKHETDVVEILKGMTDWKEPYPERQTKVEIVRTPGGAVTYVSKAIGYLAKQGDPRHEDYSLWARASGLRRIRIGGKFRLQVHREARRLGPTPEEVSPIMQEGMGPYITQEDPETPYRAMIRQAVNELATTAHGKDYWAFLQTCEDYGVKLVKDMPHCLDMEVPDPVHSTRRSTRIAILPGRWAWVVELPENHRPAICCKLCNLKDLDSQLVVLATLSTTKPRATNFTLPESQNKSSAGPCLAEIDRGAAPLASAGQISTPDPAPPPDSC